MLDIFFLDKRNRLFRRFRMLINKYWHVRIRFAQYVFCMFIVCDKHEIPVPTRKRSAVSIFCMVDNPPIFPPAMCNRHSAFPTLILVDNEAIFIVQCVFAPFFHNTFKRLANLLRLFIKRLKPIQQFAFFWQINLVKLPRVAVLALMSAFFEDVFPVKHPAFFCFGKVNAPPICLIPLARTDGAHFEAALFNSAVRRTMPGARKQRHALVGLLRLHLGKKVVKRLFNRRGFFCQQVRVLSFPASVFRQNIGQIVVADALRLHLGDDVVFKRPRRPFFRPGEVTSRAQRIVQFARTLRHRRRIQRHHQLVERLDHLGAHIACRVPLFHLRHAAVAHAAHPAEIIVQRVKPLMRQRARAAFAGQVDDQRIRLKVRVRIATPTRTEGKPQRTVQAQSLRRHAQQVCKVVQRVKGTVQ